MNPTRIPHHATAIAAVAASLTLVLTGCATHEAKLRYYPLVNDAVLCQCYRGTDSGGNVSKGGSLTAYAVYRPDQMPTAVDIEMPGYATAKNVPVS